MENGLLVNLKVKRLRYLPPLMIMLITSALSAGCNLASDSKSETQDVANKNIASDGSSWTYTFSVDKNDNLVVVDSENGHSNNGKFRKFQDAIVKRNKDFEEKIKNFITFENLDKDKCVGTTNKKEKCDKLKAAQERLTIRKNCAADFMKKLKNKTMSFQITNDFYKYSTKEFGEECENSIKVYLNRMFSTVGWLSGTTEIAYPESEEDNSI